MSGEVTVDRLQFTLTITYPNVLRRGRATRMA
jgi:hypothetical protein